MNELGWKRNKKGKLKQGCYGGVRTFGAHGGKREGGGGRVEWEGIDAQHFHLRMQSISNATGSEYKEIRRKRGWGGKKECLTCSTCPL